MLMKRAVAALIVAVALGAAATPSFGSSIRPQVGSLTFGTPGHAGVVYATGTTNGYTTSVQLAKNSTQVNIHFEKYRNSDHTRVAYYDFYFTHQGRIMAGTTGTKFSFDGTDLNCTSPTGSYAVTKASNSGSTITGLAISFNETCGTLSLTGSLTYSAK